VLIAFLTTLGIFVALTAYTLQSKLDFSWLGAGLSVCLWALIFWGLLSALFGYQPGFLYVCCLLLPAVLLCCCAVVLFLCFSYLSRFDWLWCDVV
jgi:hypothetical protein